jgi:saccharopine dehydrogenase-like NADP-dependent oxidoreductase
VNYIGLSLFENLGDPKSLDLRVGALPQVSFGPAHYSITWSPEGLINEYIKPAFRKIQGEFRQIPPLDDLETVIIDGTTYEGFTTAGGVGFLAAYEHVPTVEYKTLRYPGHRDFLQKMFAKVNGNFEDAVEFARQTFTTTRDDVVVLAAVAVDKSGKSAVAGLHFYPSEELGLTALELTTAGIGVAIVELMLNGSLPKGVLHAGQIPFEALLNTSGARLVFHHLE